MSQPPFNPGTVHTEDEFAQTEVPQDANGDPVWDPNAQQPSLPPNCPKCGHQIHKGEPNCPRCGYGDSVAYREPQPQYPDQGAQTFEPDNQPLVRAQEASQIAGAALHICQNPANHYVKEGKTFLKWEAWQAIGEFAGYTSGAPTVKDNVLGGVPGLTAKAYLKNQQGKIISEGEGFCGVDETFWKTMSDRVNVVQTRASVRVYRLKFSYIIQLMNEQYGTRFEIVPYEEMAAMLALERTQTQFGSSPQPSIQPPIGTRKPFVPQQPPSITYPTPGDYPNRPIPLPYPAQPPQPNVQQPVGQDEVWQGQLRDINIKWVNTARGQSQLFIISLTDGRSASTFDKTIAGNAQMAQGRNVEMIVKPRGDGSGRYNVQQVRPI